MPSPLGALYSRQKTRKTGIYPRGARNRAEPFRARSRITPSRLHFECPRREARRTPGKLPAILHALAARRAITTPASPNPDALTARCALLPAANPQFRMPSPLGAKYSIACCLATTGSIRPEGGIGPSPLGRGREYLPPKDSMQANALAARREVLPASNRKPGSIRALARNRAEPFRARSRISPADLYLNALTARCVLLPAS